MRCLSMVELRSMERRRSAWSRSAATVKHCRTDACIFGGAYRAGLLPSRMPWIGFWIWRRNFVLRRAGRRKPESGWMRTPIKKHGTKRGKSEWESIPRPEPSPERIRESPYPQDHHQHHHRLRRAGGAREPGAESGQHPRPLLAQHPPTHSVGWIRGHIIRRHQRLRKLRASGRSAERLRVA